MLVKGPQGCSRIVDTVVSLDTPISYGRFKHMYESYDSLSLWWNIFITESRSKLFENILKMIWSYLKILQSNEDAHISIQHLKWRKNYMTIDLQIIPNITTLS